MRTGLTAIIVCLVWTTGLFAGEPKLVHPKAVFETSQPVYKQPNQYHAFTMRLSPDGQRLLYTRPVEGSAGAEGQSAQFELVLRELRGGKEVVLPIEPLGRGWRSVPTRFNMFDPAGKRLLLPNIKVETRQIDGHASASRAVIKWLVYDIAQAKATNTGIEGGRGPVKFTADGQSLFAMSITGRHEVATKIISLKATKVERKALTAPGWVQSVCPAGDVAVFFAPPGRPTAPPAPGERRKRPPIRLILWDLKADKELALLPTYPRNGVLDDCETQWTADGRYLYYRDFYETVADGQSRPTVRAVTRIWDRQSGKLAGTVRDAAPLGPGPGASLMVLAKCSQNGFGGFMLHDASDGKEYPLGDASKNAIHACGGKIIYAEKPNGADTEVILMADIVAPKIPK